MTDLSECCEAPMTTLNNSDGTYYLCIACGQPCEPVGGEEERTYVHDNTDAVKALKYLIEEMKAGRLRIVRVESSAPVREKNKKVFQDFKEFEQTGDVYINLHFFKMVGK